MKYLCLVHCESMFASCMRPNFHFKLEETFSTEEYDACLVFNSGIQESCDTSGLIPFVQRVVDFENGKEVQWSWGYEKAMFEGDEEEEDFVIESSGHEYTWIPPIMREWTSEDSVILCGGCEGEGLADFESILSFLSVPYKIKASF